MPFIIKYHYNSKHRHFQYKFDNNIIYFCSFITVNLNTELTNHLQLFESKGNLLSDNLEKLLIAI